MKNVLSDIHPDAIIGKGTVIHKFCYIEGNVVIGKNCNIRPYVYICDGIRIRDNVFLGMRVTFTNDKTPPTKNLKTWSTVFSVVEDNVSIGANTVILPGVLIGEGSLIGAGSVVTKDIPSNEIWFGNPARFYKKRKV